MYKFKDFVQDIISRAQILQPRYSIHPTLAWSSWEICTFAWLANLTLHLDCELHSFSFPPVTFILCLDGSLRGLLVLVPVLVRSKPQGFRIMPKASEDGSRAQMCISCIHAFTHP